jgi:predicted  nucleic acid-binding Zn-ribbon protein
LRTRHKPPALVSMWMLDVFCCALGCVTLLFLLNSRMATDAVTANKNALRDLQSADKRLAAAITSLESTKIRLISEAAEREKLAAALTREEALRVALTADADKLRAALAANEKEQADTKKRLDLARDDAKAAQALLDSYQSDLKAIEKKADATAKDLASARAQANDAADLLAKRKREADALAKQMTAAATQMSELQKLVRAKDDEREVLTARADSMKKELIDLEARLRATQRELDAQLLATKAAAKAAGDELAQAKAQSTKAGTELAAAQAQIKDLTQKVRDANASIIDLQGDKAKLADKFDKMQRDSESRFAGIAMTGTRVVFLVDMSGSMGKRDLETVDATKWATVAETVAKVMRSIPTLEKYQVIVFSSRANWLFGEGEWQTYSGETSAKGVRDALLAVKPKDDTNMHAGFEKAFTLKPSGLDTIYLFSDGLPTSGPNLTPAQEALSESERGVILGKAVREHLARRWNAPTAGAPRVRINSVGFYFESAEVGAFLWAMSRENDGSFVGMSKP